MLSGFIVQKAGMSGIFTEDGKRIAVTTLKANPVVITQLKTKDQDGYQAVQIAYGTKKKNHQPIVKKLSKLKIEQSPKGFIEFEPQEASNLTLGQSITIDQVFKVGDLVDARGVSKGRGFAGVIKRHGFQRQPVTGGQSDRTRAPGAIGAQTPGKVLKGKRMPGHLGNKTATILNQPIVKIDTERNLIYLRGSVPGHFNAYLVLRKV